MKRKWFAAVLISVGISLYAQGTPPLVVGCIQDLQGSVSITRNGKPLSKIDIGDRIENYDLIKTGNNGILIIELDPSTGMKGTLTVKPKTVFTVKTETIRGNSSTDGNVISGTVGAKVKKISGDPSLRIRSGGTVMGVRGTEFEIIISINNAVLVTCVEGRVQCTDEEGAVVEAFPGQVVSQKVGERLMAIPVTLSSVRDFQERWLTEEVEAFKAQPIKALEQYAKAYARYKKEFIAATDVLMANTVARQWKTEFSQGLLPSSRDPQVMKQKSQVVRLLMEARRVLFFFERIYYRLNEIQSYLSSADLGKRLSTGDKVQTFLQQVRRDTDDLERRTAEYRFITKLYALRNEGRDPVGFDATNDDFFDDPNSFFDN
ncbi:MAG: FecR family protein [Treponemataceae bacterium]|nr:FecR family protein [Treponemataceae bacterium]